MNDVVEASAPAAAAGRARSTLVRRLVRHCRGADARLGIAIVASFVVAGLFAPWLAPYDPNESFIEIRLQGVGTAGHWLGVDTQGRDIFSRLLYGARASLVTGAVPVAVSACIAVPLGLVAAQFRLAGALIMRGMDILFAFPMVLLAILLTAILGPGVANLLIALVLVLLPYNTRVVYVEALAQRHAGYVEAAVALATPDRRILFREMLPHVVSASIVYSMTIIGTIIVTAAGLSFLGLGVQPPEADWGLMIGEGRPVLHIAPHIATLAGLSIFLLVSGFNLLGDALRDALDPRAQRHSG